MTTPSKATMPDLAFSGGGEPAGEHTTVVTGISLVGSGLSPFYIALPGSGTLAVLYEYQDQPAATAVLWHDGGSYEQLTPGVDTYNSLPGDALSFVMAYEGQSIKVAYAYV